MNPNPAIEQNIREVMRTENSAIRIKLFSADGLFNQIAHTEHERRQLVATPLFKEAHARYRELVEREENAFFGPAQEPGTPLEAKT